jgi:tetratricopeptide (TPR) repeat protein
VQDEITSAIVTTIEPQLCAAESFRAQRKPPESLDAWDLVMRALTHFWRVTREDHAAAQALLEQAIAIAPRYAHAAGVLAVTHTFGAHIGWQEPAAAAQAAEPAALAAVRADGEDAWAHLGLAGVHTLRGRFEDALAALELSLRLNPNFALAQGRYGLVLAYVGRWQEGSAAARRALRLSPRDPFTAIFNGIAAYAELVGRNYDEAIRLARAAIRDRAEFVGAHRVLTVASAMAGDLEGARAALATLRRAQPTLSLAFMAENLPMRDPAEREHYLEGLRRAGLD